MAILLDAAKDAEAVWTGVWIDAVDVYNSTPHIALSDGATAAITPAEVFLGRNLVFKWDIPENSSNLDSLLSSAYSKKLKNQAENVRAFIAAARDHYKAQLESKDGNARHPFRTLQEGDEVTKYKLTGAKRKDKVSPLQEGPYIVTKGGDTGADYPVKRVGRSKKAEWTHIDFLKKLRREMSTEEAKELPATKPHARQWSLKCIAGEKGKTRRTKQFKVPWEDNTVTWEPLGNLDHAAEVIKEWTQLSQSDKDKLQAMSPAQLLNMYEKVSADVTAVNVERRQLLSGP